jgi:hypothetical protein
MDEGLRQSRRRGRPALPPDAGKRHPLGIRTTRQLKDLLENAANSSGRSVAAEIEHRLERSFAPPDPLLPPDLRRDALYIAATFAAAGPDPEHPESQWRQNPDRYDSAMIRVIEALWRDHPEPRLARFRNLLNRVWRNIENRETGRTGFIPPEGQSTGQEVK